MAECRMTIDKPLSSRVRRRRTAGVLLTAGLALAGGCGPKAGNADPQGFPAPAPPAGMDRYSRTLPNGEREEWTLKRGRDGEAIWDGRYTKWHANGRKAAEGAYKDGVLEGQMTQWDPYGREIGKSRYKKGERGEE